MRGFKRIAGALAAAVLAASPAAATHYSSVRDLGGPLRGFLSITTDGSVGVLQAANIQSFDLVFSGLGERAANYGYHPAVSANPNTPLIFAGTSLSATPTRLFFNFDSGGGVLGVGSPLYLLTAADNVGWIASYEIFELDPEFANFFARSGVQTIGAVPEPATWLMLIAGFGLTGAVLRRRGLAGRKAGVA